ncbi:MAG: HEAT repeat domain-containing protein [Pirellulales bacterium]|nr:HEAT repeat domain-containing protein [Pirellulales bacterium]
MQQVVRPSLVICLSAVLASSALASVDDLVKQLSAEEPKQRADAAEKLGDMGASAADAVPALVKALSDDAPLVRAQAANALGDIGKPSLPAVDDLAKLLKDPDARVRRAVLDAFGKIRPGPDKAVPILSKAFKDADPSVVARALHSISEAGDRVVPAMIELLKDDGTRYWALVVLHDLGPEAKDAVPALVEILSDKRPEVRMEALMVLAAIGPDAKDAAAAVVKQLDDPEIAVKRAAALAAGRIGPACVAATPKLRDAYQKADEFHKNIAIWALAKIRTDNPAYRQTAIEKLLIGLRNKDRQIQAACSRGLIDLKLNEAETQRMVGILAKVLQTGEEPNKHEAAHALSVIGEPAVKALIHGLKHPSVQVPVASVLGGMGPKAKEAIPALLWVVDNGRAEARREALLALANIASEDPSAVIPAFTKTLKDPVEELQIMGVFALGKMGPAAKSSVPDIAKMISPKNPQLSRIAAWALTMIEPESLGESTDRVVEVLSGALSNDQHFVRIEAANALGNLGPRAKAALPALKEAANDKLPPVQEAISKAIEKIEG